MDAYVVSMLVGGVGLAVMAMSGMGHHARGGPGPSGHALLGPKVHTHAIAQHPHVGGVSHAHAGEHSGSGRDLALRSLVAFVSPRIAFSLLLGLGTSGLVLKHWVSGWVAILGAIAGALLFERLLVMPLWNLILLFASKPAATLETSITNQGTAVTSFDANGQGIVKLEVDGEIVQILGTLDAEERSSGIKVCAGERVRITEVDAARNRCTVSVR